MELNFKLDRFIKILFMFLVLGKRMKFNRGIVRVVNEITLKEALKFYLRWQIKKTLFLVYLTEFIKKYIIYNEKW